VLVDLTSQASALLAGTSNCVYLITIMRISGFSIVAGLADWNTEIRDQYHNLLMFGFAAFVPEGHLRIARRFNAGIAPRTSRVPKGRLKQVGDFSRPSGIRGPYTGAI
jgi:hypothetical protein